MNISLENVYLSNSSNIKYTNKKQISSKEMQLENKSIRSEEHSAAIRSNALGSLRFKAKKVGIQEAFATLHQTKTNKLEQKNNLEIDQKIEEIITEFNKIIEKDKSYKTPVIAHTNYDLLHMTARNIAENKIRRIAIYGEPGGGTSSVAYKANNKLPIDKRCAIVKGLDYAKDFTQDFSGKRYKYNNPSTMFTENPDLNMYAPESYNIQEMEDAISQLLKGNAITVPESYNYFACKPSKKTRGIKSPGIGVPVIIDFPITDALTEKPDLIIGGKCSNKSAQNQWFKTALDKNKKNYTPQAANHLYRQAKDAVNTYNNTNDAVFIIDDATSIVTKIKTVGDIFKVIRGIY